MLLIFRFIRGKDFKRYKTDEENIKVNVKERLIALVNRIYGWETVNKNVESQ